MELPTTAKYRHNYLEKVTNSNRKCYTPIQLPQHLTNSEKACKHRRFDTIDVNLQGESFYRAKALFQNENRLSERAREFISRISKERMKRRGQFVMLKQEEEEKRRLRQEIEEEERILNLELEKMDRRTKALDKVRKIEERIDSRMQEKKRKTNRYKTNQSQRASSENKSLVSEPGISRKYSPLSSLTRNKMEKSQALSNSIYLGQHQQQIEQTRKMLVRLSGMLDHVGKMREKC